MPPKSAPSDQPKKKKKTNKSSPSEGKKAATKKKAAPKRPNEGRFVHYVGALTANELADLKRTIATFEQVLKATEKGTK